MTLRPKLPLAIALALTAIPALAQMPMAPADQALMAGMGTMSQSMAAVPMTGDADRDFASMMTPHHKGAIDMARAELAYGHDPAMRRLATDIVAAQEKEIAEMRSWLAAHPAR